MYILRLYRWNIGWSPSLWITRDHLLFGLLIRLRATLQRTVHFTSLFGATSFRLPFVWFFYTFRIFNIWIFMLLKYLSLIKNLYILMVTRRTSRHHLNTSLTILTFLSIAICIRFVVFVQELGTLIHIILNTSLIDHTTSWFQNWFWLVFNTLRNHASFGLMIYLVLRYKLDVLWSKFRTNLVFFLFNCHAWVDRDLIRHYLLHLFAEFGWLLFSEKPSFLYLGDLLVINILGEGVHGTAPPCIQSYGIETHHCRYLLQDSILHQHCSCSHPVCTLPGSTMTTLSPSSYGSLVIIIANIFFLWGGVTISLFTILYFGTLRNTLFLIKVVVVESSRYWCRCCRISCLFIYLDSILLSL